MSKKKTLQKLVAKQQRSPEEIRTLYPTFDANSFDVETSWSDQNFSLINMRQILLKILSFQNMQWHEIGTGGSHSVKICDLNKKAQKRLTELCLDDVDSLYSIRISGKERLWAIPDNAVLRLLWWDPEHKVCPSNKKHT